MSDRSYYRRCHHCNGVTEACDSKVEQCTHCEKALAPFYYFDEHAVETLTDTGNLGKSQPNTSQYYRPLVGLSTYW